MAGSVTAAAGLVLAPSLRRTAESGVDKTLAELAQQYDIHPNQIVDWKSQLMERSAQVFGDP